MCTCPSCLLWLPDLWALHLLTLSLRTCTPFTTSHLVLCRQGFQDTHHPSRTSMSPTSYISLESLEIHGFASGWRRGCISEIVPKAQYGSWSWPSRLIPPAMDLCGQLLPTPTRSPWPTTSGHLTQLQAQGQVRRLDAPTCALSTQGWVETTSGFLYRSYLSMLSLIQQTFHDNMCQGVWINNT